jgi:XapX domain-containing protein
MRTYLVSVLLGLAVGVVYGLVKIRSPAPPAIALLGLLGMLVGEQAVTLVRSRVFKDSVQLSAVPHEAVTSDDVRSAKETDGAPTK